MRETPIDNRRRVLAYIRVPYTVTWLYDKALLRSGGVSGQSWWGGLLLMWIPRCIAGLLLSFGEYDHGILKMLRKEIRKTFFETEQEIERNATYSIIGEKFFLDI